MQVAFTPQAERDLETIGDHIADDNPVRALSFVRELRVQCLSMAENPLAYRLRPELGEGTRACPYGHYMIFFEVTLQTLVVIRVLHGARDLPAVFGANEQ